MRGKVLIERGMIYTVYGYTLFFMLSMVEGYELICQ